MPIQKRSVAKNRFVIKKSVLTVNSQPVKEFLRQRQHNVEKQEQGRLYNTGWGRKRKGMYTNRYFTLTSHVEPKVNGIT